jgi:Fe-S cluster biosynthesis and repair protein YggX
MSQQSKRATFEDVSYSQNTLRKFIDNCIVENRPLNEQERDNFLKLMQNATLGIGTKYKFYLNGQKGKYCFGHIEKAAYEIAYTEKNTIIINNEVFEIADLWKSLRKYLFDIFPYAIEMSIKISKEMVDMYQGSTSSFDYDDVNR